MPIEPSRASPADDQLARLLPWFRRNVLRSPRGQPDSVGKTRRRDRVGKASLSTVLLMTTALLVPCYNAVRFLPRLREQVDRLAPAFDEILLADDASTDDTAASASALGFRILHLAKNLGPGGARNALARESTSEWIHFHDVDDELAPDYLTRVAPMAKPDTDAVLHFTDFIDEKTRELVVRWELDAAELSHDPAAHLLLRPLPTMSSFLRREQFLAIGGFHATRRCFEDGDFHFRIGASGARLALVPEVLEWSLRHDRGAGANQHYCFVCRLEFLEDYVAQQPVRLHSVIAAEAERTAINLLRTGDVAAARRAITLAKDLGRKVPTTKHLGLRALRSLLPATTLLRWQDRWRRAN